MNWERFLKRFLGVIIIVTLLGFSFKAHSADVEAGAGTQDWQSFLIHVRQGEVDAAVIGSKCLGKDTDGHVRTVGCARWKKATGGWLDGECWITVREWGSSFLAEVLQNWGHELAHCVKGKWHE